MPAVKDDALVLSAIEYSNTSLIVRFLGRRLGRFDVLAKGARRWPRKGFEGGLDMLTRGEAVVYPRGGLWLFKEWDERARPRAGRDFITLLGASYLCDLASALTFHLAGSGIDSITISGGGGMVAPSGAGAGLYDPLINASEELARGEPPGPVLLAFTLLALKSEGFLPPLDHCSVCQSPLPGADGKCVIGYDGLHCLSCVKKALVANGGQSAHGQVQLHSGTVKLLAQIAKSGRKAQFSGASAGEAARAMAVLTRGALETELKTLPAAARIVAGT